MTSYSGLFSLPFDVVYVATLKICSICLIASHSHLTFSVVSSVLHCN